MADDSIWKLMLKKSSNANSKEQCINTTERTEQTFEVKKTGMQIQLYHKSTLKCYLHSYSQDKRQLLDK